MFESRTNIFTDGGELLIVIGLTSGDTGGVSIKSTPTCHQQCKIKKENTQVYNILTKVNEHKKFFAIKRLLTDCGGVNLS